MPRMLQEHARNMREEHARQEHARSPKLLMFCLFSSACCVDFPPVPGLEAIRRKPFGWHQVSEAFIGYTCFSGA